MFSKPDAIISFEPATLLPDPHLSVFLPVGGGVFRYLISKWLLSLMNVGSGFSLPA
jgi:hypothetical protein